MSSILATVVQARPARPFDYHQPFYILLGCIGLMLVIGMLSIFLPPLQRRENTQSDRFWKFGVFYVNPADPAIFVPKRFGIGYTLNFARPFSWLILALIFIAALAPLAFAIHSLRLR